MPGLYGLRKILFILFITISFPTFATPGQKQFDQGIKAFKGAKYDLAIIAFESARKQGLNSGLLNYNLGVSYYKVEKYNKSIAAFKRALSDKQILQRTRYNMGLVYLRQKRESDAVAMFRKAVELNTNAKLTEKAQKKLQELDPDYKKPSAKKAGKKTNGLLSFAYGRDDNVTQASTENPTNLSDNYLSTFAYIDIPVSAVTFNASLLLHDYADVDSEDLQQISVGIVVPFKTSSWSFKPSLHIIQSELNSVDFLQMTDVKFSAKKKINKKDSLGFRLRYTDIESDTPAYSYLDGNRQQFRVEYKTAAAIGDLRFRYELETNDRQNTATVNYSPTRHTLRARLKRDLIADTKMKFELVYRDSEYEADTSGTRSDTRTQIRLDVYYPFAREWTTGIRYVNTDNDSNRAAQNYKKTDIQLYLDWQF